jgi:uncharacterized membrane protein YccC
MRSCGEAIFGPLDDPLFDTSHLEVIVVLFGALGGAIRMVNYAFYCAAIAACVLIASDLPHPTNFGAEGRRVLFTLAGVGIGVVVMFLADLLQKRTAKAATAQVAATPQVAS